MSYRSVATIVATILILTVTAQHELLNSSAWAAEIKASPTITYSVFASGLNQPRGLLITPAGEFYAAEEGAGTIAKIAPNGVLTRVAKGLSAPHDLAFGPRGTLLIADGGNNRIAEMKMSGQIETYIGGLSCEWSGIRLLAFKSPSEMRVVLTGFRPHGLAFLPGGVMLVNDFVGGRIMKVTAGGAATAWVTGLDGPIGLAIGPSGDIYVAERTGGRVDRIKPNGERQILLEGLSSPRDPVLDTAGNLFVAETDAGRILKLVGNF